LPGSDSHNINLSLGDKFTDDNAGDKVTCRDKHVTTKILMARDERQKVLLKILRFVVTSLLQE
jgi:hypothetical protein